MSGGAADQPPIAGPGLRVDKWLWYTRIVKSRSLATTLVTSGKVRVNRVRIGKASHTVRVGDVITVAAHSQVHVLRIAALGTRRGPASEAQTLYEDLSATTPATRQEIANANAASPGEKTEAGDTRARASGQRDAGSGRPTKRDRRAMERLRDV
ncbi:MAG: RNA-binding S4 domain-containing protein [Pseudomonadota bacterium]